MDTDRVREIQKQLEDERFSRYTRASAYYAFLFALGLSALVSSFLLYNGLKQSQSFVELGMVIGFVTLMFLTIALYSSVARNFRKNWVGKIVNKRKYKRIKNNHVVIVYEIDIEKENGQLYVLSYENSDVLYNYYHKGEPVYYAGLYNSVIKLNKDQDSFHPCVACATINASHQDVCHRCGCPLIR